MGNPKDLIISYWNANSILNKKFELIKFLDANNIDIMTVCETFLKPGQTFNMANYIAHRIDRSNGAKGGVMVLVKRSIEHKLLPSFNLKTIEAIGVEIKHNNSPISIIGAYHPGANTDMIKFKSDILALTNTKKSYFICGDLNARHRMWNCVSSNRAGKVLFDELQKGQFSVFHPSTPTYYPVNSTNNPSTIDIIITNNKHSISNPSTSIDFTSDHLPVRFNIENLALNSKPECEIFDYSNANWYAFQSHLRNTIQINDLNISNIQNKAQIDNMLEKLTEEINRAHNIAIPKRIPGKYNIIIPNSTLSLIKIRNMYRKKIQRQRNNTTLKSIYTQLTQTINTQLNLVRNAEWSKNLSSMNNPSNSNKVWKFVKIIKNQPKTIQTLKEGGKILLTHREKCEALKSHFLSAHNTTINNSSTQENKVNQTVNSFHRNNNILDFDPSELIKPKDIIKIIKNLKSKKSTGLDKVNNRTIKKLPRNVLVYLNLIFNSCLKLGYFPKSWKISKVIAISKPGKDSSLAKNYRPISLLSCLGKIFEKLISHKLRAHTQRNNIIPKCQFGFQPGLSTTHQLDRLKKDIISSRNLKKSTGLVLLDSEKAFDTIWHKALIYKLIKLHFPNYLIHIIQSFITDRQNIVHISNSTSDAYTPPAGVPQGSVLSPILFNIFISDIPKMKNCNQYLYADDVAISSNGKQSKTIIKSLNCALKIYSKYCEKWKLKINGEKSEAIFFTRFTKSNKIPNTQLQINNTDIPWKVNIKYLGLTLDKRLTYRYHIENTVIKCEKIFRALYCFLNRKSKLNIKNKLLLYTSLIRPIITYASQVWITCAKTHQKKLQTIQNKYLKTILNVPPWHRTHLVHSSCNIDTVEQHITKLSSNYNNRNLMNSNSTTS